MPTDFFTRRAQQAESQQLVNDTYAAGLHDAALALALALAQAEHAEYPHYEGHWDGWTLGVATMDCKNKGGDQALRGDVVLVKIELPRMWCSPSHTFYSVRLGWDCSFSTGVKPVQGWAAYYEEAHMSA